LYCLDLIIIYDGGSAGSINDDDSGYKRIRHFGSDKLVVVLLPDGEDTSNSEICIENTAAVKWVECNDIVALADLDILRTLFTEKSTYKFVLTKILFNEIVGLYV